MAHGRGAQLLRECVEFAGGIRVRVRVAGGVVPADGALGPRGREGQPGMAAEQERERHTESVRPQDGRLKLQ